MTQAQLIDFIADQNAALAPAQGEQFDFLADQLSRRGIDVQSLVEELSEFQVAVPSWALGAGGTRFGRFGFGGEPGTLS